MVPLREKSPESLKVKKRAQFQQEGQRFENKNERKKKKKENGNTDDQIWKSDQKKKKEKSYYSCPA